MEVFIFKDEVVLKFRFFFILVLKNVFIYGKVVEIRGGIKSLDLFC